MMKKALSLSLLSLFIVMAAFGGFAGSSTALASSAEAEHQQSNNATHQRNWFSWLQRGATISDISPETGPVGTTITLTGKKFNEDSTVRFGSGVVSDVTVSEDGKVLSFVLPEEIGTYCPPNRVCTAIAQAVVAGEYKIQVQNGYRRSNAVWFEVIEDGTIDDEEISIEKISGPTSLVVDTEGMWTVDVLSEVDGNLEYSVKWGDEGTGIMRLFGASEEVTQSSSDFTHTYTTLGTYQPEFTVTDEEGNTVTKLADPVVVGNEGTPQLISISPTLGAVGSSVVLVGTGFDVDSTVTMGDTVVNNIVVDGDTNISFTIPVVSTGTYSVTVTDDEGTSNTLSFTVQETETLTNNLSVNGISAPTKLTVGDTGTWTVNASTNLTGNLMYSVDWGEGASSAMARTASMVQSSATFTHSYEVAGTYKPTFTVTDELGHTAKVSASVLVVADTE